jgi:hypothetical protein
MGWRVSTSGLTCLIACVISFSWFFSTSFTSSSALLAFVTLGAALKNSSLVVSAEGTSPESSFLWITWEGLEVASNLGGETSGEGSSILDLSGEWGGSWVWSSSVWICLASSSFLPSSDGFFSWVDGVWWSSGWGVILCFESWVSSFRWGSSSCLLYESWC